MSCFYCLECGSHAISLPATMNIEETAKHFGVSREWALDHLFLNPANPDGAPFVLVGKKKRARTDQLYQRWYQLEDQSKFSLPKYTELKAELQG